MQSRRRPPRPIIFELHLQPLPSVDDPIKVLKAALKTLLRRYRLRAIDARQISGDGR